jgi:uncharacterized protein YyaL (SSP411 family)
MTVKREEQGQIEWREWTKHSFDEAREKNKLVLLDLTATWCHWCHVMDDTTYADPGVARMINENFIPVRVDIDKRPDISDRYNRGGFPTTAFLSDLGESVWGATFIPPSDMKRIMGSILEAKASGKIDQTLERNRLQFLDLAKSWKKPLVDSDIVEGLFEDIFSTYDVEHGGFGTSPKFPHPDAVELLMFKHALDGDNEIVEAAIRTIDEMGAGLYDTVEGGVFRYSVTRDWKEPHYEKMLETNIGYLRNLAHAQMLTGHEKHAKLAKGVAKYIIDVLQDPASGGFFGSQDADEEYYKMTRDMRSRRPAPSIDKTIYSGWNSEAVSTLIWAGAIMGESQWIASARKAWRYCVAKLWNPRLGLIRHAVGQEVYLFDDQVSFLEALLAVMELQADENLLDIGRALIKKVDMNFADSDGGYVDILKTDDAIGELGTPKRSLVSNSKWAGAMALFGAASHDSSLEDKARGVLLSFNQQEAEAHGLFAASFISTWWLLEHVPMLVEIHNSSSKNPLDAPLWMAAKRAMNPAAVVVLAGESEPTGDSLGKPFATICDDSGCSKEFTEPRTLAQRLSYKKA